MAVATSFPESDRVLDKPKGMTYDECEALAVLTAKTPEGRPVVISCWKLTAEEMAEVQRTGRVWLLIHGRTMPPASVAGLKPFTADEGN